jgi:hypothetical protein
MHFDSASICSMSCADGVPSPPDLPAGMSFAHLASAAVNAGDDGLIPSGSWMPPSGPGSGKFDTPWLRMQSTYASACDPELPAAPTGLEEPQAAIASADPTRRSRTTGRRRGKNFRCTAAPVTAP